MDWSKLTDWIQLRPRYLFPVFVAATVLLFAPSAILALLGLSEIVDDFRPWIGIGWLTAAALLLTHVLAETTAPFRVRIKEWFRVRRLIKRIPALSPQELQVLSWYIDEQKATQILPISSGVAGSLEAKKIIFRSATISTGQDRFAYTMQPWAWEYLT